MTDSDAHDNKSSDAQCPTCGRDDFADTPGMKRHHAHVHGESIAGVDVECAQCGAMKNVPVYYTEDNDRHFCSDECESEWRSEYYSGESSPTWKGGKVEVDCTWCGTPKQVKQHVKNQQERFFCDNECLGEWCAENQSGEDSPTWAGGDVTVECANCGDTKDVYPVHAEQRDNHFCSNECQHDWVRETGVMAGENNPMYSGGHPEYGPGWNESKRELVRESQDYECAGCGLSQSENWGALDVHHIQKADSFDDPEKRNDPDNLAALCRSCHRTWEKMSPLHPQ